MTPFVPAFIWAIVILALSTNVGIQMPAVFFSPDKLGHFAAYGLLAMLMLYAQKSLGSISWRHTLLTVFWATLYGIVLEIVQWAFYPNRFFEVGDMFANFGGALICSLLFRFLTTQN
ncbi:MAG: VanZ family protein [Lewinellaceae bacterium]|nr:VanZ family protein [Lewinellaceae bacterium]